MQKELFQPRQYLNPKWYIFKDLELGSVYDCLPWDQLSECLPNEFNNGVGAPRWFSNRGMIAMMFLKSYLKLSDEKLVERFNTDWSLQMFCGKVLRDGERIRDKAIVSRIRTYIGKHADLYAMQRVLLDHWKRDMSNTHVLLMDATCYESYIRFPTDVKILWESCHWVFEKQIFGLCRTSGVKRPRSKYLEQKRRQGAYERKRRKTYKEGHKRKRSLLYLLEKGLGQLQELLNQNPQIRLTSREYAYLRTIRKVWEQQSVLFLYPGAKIDNRIVSLHKPYVRPIVRGKENKRVEFGMKAHMLQVDGITLFENMSFDAFNESTRLKISVLKHKSYFGACHQLGADRIYATNNNRKYLTAKDIFTCFPAKGPKVADKQRDIMRMLLGKARSTVLEGSFGHHKTFYGLHKIKALSEKNEKVWAFFGVMTANAVLMGRRNREKPLRQAA